MDTDKVISWSTGGKFGYVLPAKQVEIDGKHTYLWEPNHFLHTRLYTCAIRHGHSFTDKDTGKRITYLQIR